MLRFSVALGLAWLAFSVHGQHDAPAAAARKPASAPVPYLIETAASLADLEKTLAGPGAHGANLVKPGPLALEVVWKHEQETQQNGVEEHDGRDHVFYVTDGSVQFTLGGEMEEPKEVSPGEWRGPRSRGAKTIELKKGDLIVIPHGTVHARSSKGTHFTMLQLSFWQGGAPQPAASH